MKDPKIKRISFLHFIFTFALFVFIMSCNQTPEQKSTTAKTSVQDSVQVKDSVLYACPMHPEVIAYKPAQCTECGMDLELATADN